MKDVVEYDCEGYGAHVTFFGKATIPKFHFCCVCEWLCEFVPDPEQMEQIRIKVDTIRMGKDARSNCN